MSRVAQKFPRKYSQWLSLSHKHKKKQPNGFAAKVYDCIIQLLRLIILSLQSI